MYFNFCSNVSGNFKKSIKTIIENVDEGKRIHAIINSYTFNIIDCMSTGNIIL